MSAWGANSASKSCKALLDKVEGNDPQLTELFILPTKTFGTAEVIRLSQIIENGTNTNLKTLSASGHKLSNESFFVLGKAIAAAASSTKTDNGGGGGGSGLLSIAIGDNSMGYTGILALTKGLRESAGGTNPCCRLEEIDLSWKGIGRSGFELILSTFTSDHFPHLRILNLRRNDKIGSQEEGIEGDRGGDGDDSSACISFEPIAHLKELDLSQCGLSADFVTQFFSCLQAQSQQQTQEQPDADTGIQTARTVLTTTNLLALHIQENPIQSEGFKALLPILVGGGGGAASSFSSSSLQHLNVSHCQIGDEAIQSWLDLATANATTSSNNNNNDNNNGTLQSLDLSYNEITSIGIQSLTEGLYLSGQRNLVELNLAGNTGIGQEGVQLLAQAIRGESGGTERDDGDSNSNNNNNKTAGCFGCLKKLDLTNTNCGIHGAIAILTATAAAAETVTASSTDECRLQSLYLFNNNLGSDGFIALASSLRGGHPTLEHLDLGGNGANQASVVVLLNSLIQQGEQGGEEENNNNAGSMTTTSTPNTIRSSNNRLKVLVVGGNEGGDAVEQIVTKVQQVHPALDIARDKKAQRQTH